jgi:hypothetical protein
MFEVFLSPRMAHAIGQHQQQKSGGAICLKRKSPGDKLVELSRRGCVWNKRATFRVSQGGAARKPNELTQRETLLPRYSGNVLADFPRGSGRSLAPGSRPHEDGTVSTSMRSWIDGPQMFWKHVAISLSRNFWLDKDEPHQQQEQLRLA